MNTDNLCYFNANHDDSRAERHRFTDAGCADRALDLTSAIDDEGSLGSIVGRSAAFQQVLRAIETVGSTDSTVLLLGETGTGKELVARAIHEGSRRGQRAMVKVNCAAIPRLIARMKKPGIEARRMFRKENQS